MVSLFFFFSFSMVCTLHSNVQCFYDSSILLFSMIMMALPYKPFETMHVPVPGNQPWRSGPFRCVPGSPYPSLFYTEPSVSPSCTDNSSYTSFFQTPLQQDQGPPAMPNLSTYCYPHENNSPIVGPMPFNKDPYDNWNDQRRNSYGSQDSGYQTHGVSFSSYVPDEDMPAHSQAGTSVHHREDSVQSPRTQHRETNYKNHHRGRSCKKMYDLTQQFLYHRASF